MRLGPYELEGEIGRGGMGSVYKARGPGGATVAVKILLRLDAERRARFERERRLLGALSEADGFVPLLDAGESGDVPWIAMPFLEGGTLRDRIEKGPLPIEDAVRLVATLARALGRAHASGIVHRDMKPENVLHTHRGAESSGYGLPLVADLGLAKHFDRSGSGGGASLSLSVSREMRGTIAYMAPEQLEDAKSVGPPADVFALGAILYECVTGRPAFVGENALEVTGRIAAGNYAPVRRHRAETPDWLVRVIARALAPRAKDRFADGEALARSLEARESGERGPWLARVAVAALVVLLAAGAVLHAASGPRGGGEEPGTAPGPVSSSSASVSTQPTPGEPAWFRALARDERPALPLPRGIDFGKEPGEYVNEKDGTVLVWVREGTCRMGDTGPNSGADEQPRVVTLSAHWIGKYEVTVRQFEAFVAATGHRTHCEKEGFGGVRDGGTMPSQVPGLSWRKPLPEGGAPLPAHPVTQMARDDATAYARWAGLRLPTEAEWEQAARWDPATGAMRKFSWGDTYPGTAYRVANVADEAFRTAGARDLDAHIAKGYDDGEPYLAPVGSYPAGASAVGALDMTGNACEWVADGYDSQPHTKKNARDPFEPPTSLIGVIRGGSFASRFGWDMAWHRHRELPFTTADDTGFRLARSAR